MKKSSQHAFEPEEIMAYLDGELPAQEAAELANHLERCDECQALAAQLRQLSERLLDFQVEPCPAKVDYDVLIPADARESSIPVVQPSRLGWRHRSAEFIQRLIPASPLGWASVFGVLAVLILVAVVTLNRLPTPRATTEQEVAQLDVSPAVTPAPPMVPPPPALADKARGIVGGVPGSTSTAAGEFLAGRARASTQSQAENEPSTGVAQGPMIVQTASITILATNYGEASKAVQRITAQHGGYVQELNANTQTGAARSLSATLRIPEKQLEPCLADLRNLGHVEQESRSNEEITDRYIDLTARLRNARAEQQRILELLKTQTGKLSDVLAAERELARIGGDIESMEGQRTYMEHEVAYASVQLQLDEQYRAQLNPEAFSTGTRIRNSLVEGFRNLGDGIVAIVMFVFAYGPSILFWAALIGFPAWFAWRRFRPTPPRTS